MIDIVLPPTNPRPIEPKRRFKTKLYTRAIIEKVLGPAPGWEMVEGRYTRRDGPALPLRMFLANIMTEAKNIGLDLDAVVVRRGGGNTNSVAIEQRIFTESEESYLQRYEKYERACEEHRRWDELPASEKKKAMANMKKHKKLIELQKKKDALKEELNKINDELQRTAVSA